MRLMTGLVVVAALSGCGTMNVSRVPAEDAKPRGVRVQVPASHVVLAVLPGAGDAVAYRGTEMVLPSREEVYDLDFQGGVFQSSKLALTANANGTVKSYKFERIDSGAAVTGAAAGAADAVIAKRKEITDAAATNPLDEANAQLERKVLNLMLNANRNAIENGLTVPFPGLHE